MAIEVHDSAAAVLEQVIIKGDLAKLSEADRVAYYNAVCNSLGLNPLTRPFEYITLNGRLTLYARRDATDQIRSLRGITITSLSPSQVGDLLVVVATGRDRMGREDSATGAVSTKGLQGESLANAMMKAETKAKRRLTLSLAGLGFVTEDEVEDIRADVEAVAPVKAPTSLAERVAARREAIAPPAEPEPSEAVVEAEAVEVEPATCGQPSAFTEGQVCILVYGHLGNHKSGNRESWAPGR